MEASKSAQTEMSSFEGEKRVLKTLTGNIPPAAVQNYKTDEKRLVHSNIKNNGRVHLRLAIQRGEQSLFNTERKT